MQFLKRQFIRCPYLLLAATSFWVCSPRARCFFNIGKWSWANFFSIGIFAFVSLLLEFFYILLVVVDHGVDIFAVKLVTLELGKPIKGSLGFTFERCRQFDAFLRSNFLSVRSFSFRVIGLHVATKVFHLRFSSFCLERSFLAATSIKPPSAASLTKSASPSGIFSPLCN